MEALTPHQFLLGRPSIAIPYLPDAHVPKSQENVPSCASSHGQHLGKMAERVSPSAQYPPEMVQGTSTIGRKRPGVDYRSS